MSDRAIAILRWLFLGNVALDILLATVLLRAYLRWIVQPWFAMGERRGYPTPPLMLNERLHKAFLIFGAVTTLGIWWFLGTPTGVDLLRHVVPSR